jgi:hypothetical protein
MSDLFTSLLGDSRGVQDTHEDTHALEKLLDDINEESIAKELRSVMLSLRLATRYVRQVVADQDNLLHIWADGARKRVPRTRKGTAYQAAMQCGLITEISDNTRKHNHAWQECIDYGPDSAHKLCRSCQQHQPLLELSDPHTLLFADYAFMPQSFKQNLYLFLQNMVSGHRGVITFSALKELEDALRDEGGRMCARLFEQQQERIIDQIFEKKLTSYTLTLSDSQLLVAKQQKLYRQGTSSTVHMTNLRLAILKIIQENGATLEKQLLNQPASR